MKTTNLLVKPKTKLNKWEEGGKSTKPTAGSPIGYKARVLPSPTLNTVVQEVLARAVT